MQLNIAPIISTVNAWVARYYYWCVAAVSVLCLVIGWFLFLQKEYASIQQFGLLDLRTANTQLAQRKAYLQDIQNLEQEYRNLNAEQLQQLNAVLPRNVDEISLLSTMQSFAEAANATILSIDVTLAGNAQQLAQAAQQSTKKGGTATTAPLVSNTHINVAYVVINIEPQNASYLGFKAFLQTLDQYAPVLNLRQMTYSPETTSYALQLETYYGD